MRRTRSQRLSNLLIISFGSVVAANCVNRSRDGVTPGSLTAAEAAPRSRELLVRYSELQAASTYSLYDALARLRPELLRPANYALGRGSATVPVVYLNGARTGELPVLHSVPRTHVIEVQFMRGQEALVRLGPGHEGGALLVTLVKL